MSRVTTDPFVPGEDARDATTIATTFASFVTVSADIDDDNIAEEGLDERSLARQAASELVEYATSTGWTLYTNTAYATLLRSTSFVVPAGYKCKVIGAFSCASSATDAGIANNRYVSARLAYSISGSPTAIVNTVRSVGANDSPAQAGDIVTGTVLPAGTYDWVEIQSQISATGTYRAGYATVICEMYYTG